VIIADSAFVVVEVATVTPVSAAKTDAQDNKNMILVFTTPSLVIVWTRFVWPSRVKTSVVVIIADLAFVVVEVATVTPVSAAKTDAQDKKNVMSVFMMCEVV
jgi:hypothetical protein